MGGSFYVDVKARTGTISQGEPITGLFLIISGSFSLTFPGGEYTLSGGDVLGICELSGSTHFMTAQALENSSLLPCAVTDFASLKSFLAENTDYCSIFSRSAFRQIGCLFRYYEATEEKAIYFPLTRMWLLFSSAMSVRIPCHFFLP